MNKEFYRILHRVLGLEVRLGLGLGMKVFWKLSFPTDIGQGRCNSDGEGDAKDSDDDVPLVVRGRVRNPLPNATEDDVLKDEILNGIRHHHHNRKNDF